ncbi:MAG: hypothetical protein IJI45_18320 [Anaerolineaceae bacterium]|nr:hypothetical protein [Anaerolineaceae bacterium]
MTRIEILQSFVVRNGTTGDLTSYAKGQVVDADDTFAEDAIGDGLAQAYTLITPTGDLAITKNGQVDVTEYASVTVTVE